MKARRQSRTLWLNGVMGVVSTVAAGLAFFSDFMKDILPSLGYTTFLLFIAANNTVNWYLRMHTSTRIKQ